jgi:cobalt-zinc-cadmium efflux system outer membrane protein
MNLINSIILLIGAVSFVAPATGQSALITDLMERSIRSSPSVLAAMADTDRASAAADRIASGPYEFEVTASGGQRRIDDPLASENRYTEWSTGLSRTIRLPEKRRIDRDLARLEQDIARSKIKQAMVMERQQFAALWGNWRRAHLLTGSSTQQADEARRIADLAQVTVDRGAERQIRADQLAADAEMLWLQAKQDQAAEALARSALVARYPDISFPERPPSLDVTDAKRLTFFDEPVSNNPAYRVSQLLAEKARLQARRARSDRFADPTVGLEFGNEFGGSETSLMARITIPIGGGSRTAHAREMSQNAVVADLNTAAVERHYFQVVEGARASLRSSVLMHDQALKAAASSTRILETIQKGYELGEITVPELLNYRRSYVFTQRTVAEYRADLEISLLTLMALTDHLLIE